MKKLLSLMLVCILVLSQMAALSEIAIPQETDDPGYHVTPFVWNNDSEYHADLVIENTSDKDSIIEVTMLFKNKDGDIIGVINDMKAACEAGYETFWSFFNETAFDDYEYEITMSDAVPGSCIQSDLELSVSMADNKIIIKATNKGAETIYFVEYHILCLDENVKVADYKNGFIGDKDYEIKPGKTVYSQETSDKTFEAIYLYANETLGE